MFTSGLELLNLDGDEECINYGYPGEHFVFQIQTQDKYWNILHILQRLFATSSNFPGVIIVTAVYMYSPVYLVQLSPQSLTVGCIIEEMVN